MLRIHTINNEVKIERNTGTRLKKAGDLAVSLGVFRARDMVAAGYSREYLRRLVGREQVRQLGRGLYASVKFDGDHHLYLVEAAKRMPRGVVCLISALQFHRIGTQSPHQLWLALPRGTNFPRSGNPPFRFCKFSKASYTFGVEEHTLPGGTVRIYSPAKTVADCFKYRNMNELTKAAAVCRVSRVLQPYLEMLT
jgi:predicted transcriptional regulator of viral defense system